MYFVWNTKSAPFRGTSSKLVKFIYYGAIEIETSAQKIHCQLPYLTYPSTGWIANWTFQVIIGKRHGISSTGTTTQCYQFQFCGDLSYQHAPAEVVYWYKMCYRLLYLHANTTVPCVIRLCSLVTIPKISTLLHFHIWPYEQKILSIEFLCK